MSKPPNTKLVEKEGVDFYGLKITEGKYKDVIFYIGQVRFIEDKENDQCTFKYDFKVDSTPDEYSIEELNDDIEFKNTVGDILIEILEENAEEPEKANTE
jgi:hypothetical protein